MTADAAPAARREMLPYDVQQAALWTALIGAHRGWSRRRIAGFVMKPRTRNEEFAERYRAIVDRERALAFADLGLREHRQSKQAEAAGRRLSESLRRQVEEHKAALRKEVRREAARRRRAARRRQ